MTVLESVGQEEWNGILLSGRRRNESKIKLVSDIDQW